MLERRTAFVSQRTWQAFSEFKAGITGRKGEDAVARELERLGLAALHDVILEDAHGLTQIDHLVLGPQAIVVLETKTYAGYITGSTYSSEWVQVLKAGTVRHSFQNPLRQNHRHCKAVEARVPPGSVPIWGFVVSAGRARFCDELVDVAVPVARLADLFRHDNRFDDSHQELENVWRILSAAAAEGEALRERHAAELRFRRSGRTWT